MTNPKNWLEIRPEGLYCVPGQFFIDPTNSVDAAIITHGHADHARSGHQKVLTTPATAAIMQARYGEYAGNEIQTLNYYEHLKHNQVELYFLPAGHILGSAQIVLEHEGSRLIISGDYKRSSDPTCEPFMVENCDVFITEATFALPIFKHPPIITELQKLLDSMQQYPHKAHLVGAYVLGKCQRIIKTLRLMGYLETIYVHGAFLKICEVYKNLGIDLGDIQHASLLENSSPAGKLILCPPGALHDRWSRRFGDSVIANASGWMRIRARAKQLAVDLPLVISDHADWDELTRTIAEIQPQEIWVTHGREEALVYYAFKAGLKARALSLLGYDEELED